MYYHVAMIKLFVKNILLILLLMCLGGQLVSADVRNYQYDGKLPFVQMMLDMMSGMGILDRVPANGTYGRYGAGRYGASRYSNSPWSRSFLRGNGRNDGGWGDNGLGGRLWDDDKWGDPRWGVLPPESYASSGWGDESWQNSPWNSQRQAARTESAYNENDMSTGGSSPRAGVGQPYQPRRQPSAKQTSRQSNNLLNSELKQKPCVTDSCGLEKPDLNGLWVSEMGEMLGIKDNSYLWSDGDSRYLTGRIKVENEYLLTSIDGSPQLVRFKYKYSGNHLLTSDPNGKIREFMRMSAAQYYNFQQGDGQNYYRGYN